MSLALSATACCLEQAPSSLWTIQLVSQVWAALTEPFPSAGVLLVVGDVDFESLDPPLGASEVVLSLTVQASDGGVPAMTATADIFVTVTDENDNSPVFQGTPYAASVRENSAAGVEVIAVSENPSTESNT